MRMTFGQFLKALIKIRKMTFMRKKVRIWAMKVSM